MRIVEIKRIELVNFRGLNLVVTPINIETKFFGLNGVGKSSIAEACSWLFSGYTNANSVKNYNLYDNTKTLTHETHATKVIIDVEINGIITTLERSAKPSFVRKRGTNTYEKSSSDTYTYAIDNIDTSVSDFQSWIETQTGVPFDMLVYCIDGSYFSVLSITDKNKARKVLENIVGEVKFSDLKGDYTELELAMSKGFTLEQVTSQQKELRKKYEESMGMIDLKIKSKEEDLATLRQTPFSTIENEIAEKKSSIEDIDKAILGKAESIKPILGERDRIFDLINSKTLKLNEGRNTYLNKFSALKNDILRQINNVRADNDSIKQRNEEKARQYDALGRDIESMKRMLEALSKEREMLVADKDKLKAQVFTDDKCVYCGQELPADMIEEKRKQFNESKTKQLEVIIAKGKNVKERIENLQNDIQVKSEEHSKGFKVEPYISLDELQLKLDEVAKSYVPYEETDEYKVIFNEIETLKNSLPEMPDNDTDALTNVKKSLIEDLEQLNRQLGRKDDCLKIEREIEELLADKRSCANKQSEVEGRLQMIQDYTEEKANYVSNKINDKLDVAKIEMFRTQKDGTLAPDCVVRNKKGVMYATANGAQKILLNIDLQQMFCEHFGVVMPIFVDECSMFSPSLEPKFEAQNFKFYASDDKVLRIE